MSDQRASIPRRLIYRALADVLGGQARHFAGLAERSERRRPGRPLDPSKAPGRELRVARLRAQADELGRRVGDPEWYRGPGLDPALFGLVVAVAYGHAEALSDLRAAAGDPLDGITVYDLVELLDRLIGRGEAGR